MMIITLSNWSYSLEYTDRFSELSETLKIAFWLSKKIIYKNIYKEILNYSGTRLDDVLED